MILPESELLGDYNVVLSEVLEECGVDDFLKDLAQNVEETDRSVAMGFVAGFTRFWDWVNLGGFPLGREVGFLDAGLDDIVQLDNVFRGKFFSSKVVILSGPGALLFGSLEIIPYICRGVMVIWGLSCELPGIGGEECRVTLSLVEGVLWAVRCMSAKYFASTSALPLSEYRVFCVVGLKSGGMLGFLRPVSLYVCQSVWSVFVILLRRFCQVAFLDSVILFWIWLVSRLRWSLCKG